LEEHVYRSSAYKRVDVGLNFRALDNEDRHLRKNPIRNIWLGLDCLNIFGFDNVSGYYWVTDVKNVQYAVPNYLTGRMVNFRVNVEF
ncbi:MAG: TonB-dependent receptor, partial [Planctomycetia bacterium]|nr:TonB-dependent receptor [Planctomycetia bacterium]